MIQVETVILPYINNPDEYEIASYSLYLLECKVRRMKYMIELGYYCQYSDDE